MTENNKKTNKTFIALILLSGIFSGIMVGSFFALNHDLPQIESLKSFKPSSVSRVYSSDNILLTEFFAEKRDPVPIKQIPDDLKTALVNFEDRNFYKHSGVDLKGILRAIVKDLIAGEFVEGASTITQQLAKTLFLTSKKTLVRKIREAILAFQLERRYTKDEILEYYLNQVYFGSGAYGVESAARIFFGKPVSELSLPECALIAAMPRSPSRYSPFVNPDLSVKRRNIVLKVLFKRGHITEEVFNEAINTPLKTAPKSGRVNKASYFTEYIKNQLELILGSSRLYKSGLTIHTTLSYDLQMAAEGSSAKHLAKLEARMKKAGLPDTNPQYAMISMDVETGAILAMAGGKDYSESPYNRATVARRQPGSAFKPFVYACAVEKGFSQNMLILDAPVSFEGARHDTPWEPENYSKTYLGEITLRKSLALSKNIPAIRLIEKIGPSVVAGFARRAGIKTPLSQNLSLALGTSETTLFDLVSAYSVFPNRGQKTKPFAVTRIENRSGRTIWKAEKYKQIVMSRQDAAIITNILEGVVNEGTGRRAKILDRPVAGKTGTTDMCKDALFIGFSPAVATGVWVGLDNHHTLGSKETGAQTALPIWIDIMEASFKNKPVKYFDIPEGVVQVRMDPDTGRAAPADSTRSVSALFQAGKEPAR